MSKEWPTCREEESLWWHVAIGVSIEAILWVRWYIEMAIALIFGLVFFVPFYLIVLGALGLVVGWPLLVWPNGPGIFGYAWMLCIAAFIIGSAIKLADVREALVALIGATLLAFAAIAIFVGFVAWPWIFLPYGKLPAQILWAALCLYTMAVINRWANPLPQPENCRS